MDTNALVSRIERLERRNRWLTAALAVLAIGSLAGMGSVAGWATAGALASPAREVTLRSLTIVDAAGTPRVRLAAPEPEPIVLGQVRHRDGPVSGVMLYDAKGNERGGYVTSDSKTYSNVFLTLDGEARQGALFLAEPDGGTTLRLFKDKANMAQMSLYNDKPGIKLVEGGRTVFEQPAR